MSGKGLSGGKCAAHNTGEPKHGKPFREFKKAADEGKYILRDTAKQQMLKAIPAGI